MGGKASIIGFSSTLQANQFFKVKMLMTDNRVKVYVTDSQTGEELPLGILTDPNNIFPIGAPGIAVRDREQNVIGNFIVCTPSCK
jgi:glycine betaine/choline ABC-type transport system substrate-binding protein